MEGFFLRVDSNDDFINWLNLDFFKEIQIDNWKLIILDQDIENVIKKDFLKTSTEDEYNELIQKIIWTSKSIKALNLVGEILENYWNIPIFIKSLQNINLGTIQEENSVENIPF